MRLLDRKHHNSNTMLIYKLMKTFDCVHMCTDACQKDTKKKNLEIKLYQ